MSEKQTVDRACVVVVAGAVELAVGVPHCHLLLFVGKGMR